MTNELRTAAVSRTQEQLNALRGGHAKIWHFRYSYSTLVVRVAMPHWSSRRAYLDCVACSRLSFVPSWEPVNLVITERPDVPNAPLLVVDGDRFQVECQSVQVQELDDDQGRCPFPPTAGLGASGELVDRIREAWSGVFLTEPKFGSLRNFLRGYETAVSDHRLAWTDDLLSLVEFQNWVKARLGCENLSLNWERAIVNTYQDNDEAYRRFFELWAEYRTYKHSQIRPTPPTC